MQKESPDMDRQASRVAIHTTQEVGKTGQPLVIKGVDRIEAIFLQRPDVRRDAAIYTHVISRMMRRDFNFASVKLFWYTRSRERRSAARAILQDLVDEAQRLEDMARPFEMPAALVAATCRMRIISDEAELLFDALMQVDRALHKLMHSSLAEVAEDNAAPFLRAFTTLLRKVSGLSSGQRSRQDGPVYVAE